MSAALAFVLAACTVPGIGSISLNVGSASLSVGETVDLDATANDVVGSPDTSVTWTSSNTSVATVDANGVVSGVALGSATITATSTFDTSKTADASITVRSEVAFAVAETIYVTTFDGSGPTTTEEGSPPPEPTIDGPAIFGAAVHPSGDWVYFTSMASNTDTDGVWGGARILQAEVAANGFASISEAYRMLDVAGITCSAAANGSDNEGDCAPTELAFTPSGSRLFVNEDSEDTVLIFDVDGSTGALTFVAEVDTLTTSNVEAQGIAVHPTEAYVYNGPSAYNISGDTLTDATITVGGNGTTVVSASGSPLLYTTIANFSANNLFGIYDLTDPSTPTLIDDIDLGNKGAVFFAASPDGDQIVVVGNDTITSLSFDGSTLTNEDQVTYAETDVRVYRGAAWVRGTSQVLATWFVSNQAVGGQTLVSVASDGTLTVDEETASTGVSRVAVSVR